MLTLSPKVTTAPRSRSRSVARKSDRRLVDDLHLVGHARAGVDEKDEINRHLVRLEELHVLQHAVFVDREVVLPQAGHEPFAVADGDIERHETGAAAKDRSALLGGRRSGAGRASAGAAAGAQAAGSVRKGDCQDGTIEGRGVSQLPPHHAAVQGAFRARARDLLRK